MKNFKQFILLILYIHCLNSFSQNTISINGKTYIDSCDLWNLGKNGKYRISEIGDIRLQRLLKKFFILDDTDTTWFPLNFSGYPCNHCDSSIAYISIDSGLAKGYTIKLQVVPFNLAKHKVRFKEMGYICQIDNKGFWGVETNLPNEEISGFRVTYFDKSILISPSQYNDLFNPYLTLGHQCRLYAVIDKKGEYFLVVLNGSDFSVGYVAIWIFKKDKYIGRVMNM